MRFHILLLIIIILIGAVQSQNGSWWEPAQPSAGDTVTIYFDPAQNSEIPNNTSTLVLHWGVNEQGSGNWQTPPAYLRPAGTVLHSDSVAARTPFSKNSQQIWEVRLPTDSTIFSIHYVVNTGTPASPGGNWGHNTGGANWNIDIFIAPLTVSVLQPQVEVPFGDGRRSPLFISLLDTIHFIGNAVVNNSRVSELRLLADGFQVAQTSSDTLNYDFAAAVYGYGYKKFTFIGTDTAGYADSTEFYTMINPPVQNGAAPAGIEDGINYNSPTSVTLSLFAPYKDFVYLIGDFNNWMVDTQYLMNRDSIGPDSVRWWLQVDGLTPGQEYGFQYLVDGEIRIADPYTDKLLDPWNDQYIPDSIYPSLKPFPEGKTDFPVSVFETAQTPFNWVYSDTFQRPEKKDLIIYEMLLRDFLADHDFETLADTLDYFQRLGVNAIE
ncbi:MAG: hypothetical protein WAN36_00065, partial [Calditrichia bacterium]